MISKISIMIEMKISKLKMKKLIKQLKMKILKIILMKKLKQNIKDELQEMKFETSLMMITKL